MSIRTHEDGAAASIFHAWSLLQQFYWDLDHFDYSRLGTYFDEKSVLRRKGVELIGLQRIIQALTTRDPHLVTRHVLGLPVLKESPADAPVIGGYMTIYRVASTGTDERQLLLPGPWRLYDVHSEWNSGARRPVVRHLKMWPIYEFESANEK